MRIIPVLDLLHGQVVRGIAGQRDHYRPIVSRWTTSADPLTVAQSLRDAFGLTHFYVADLDAILQRKPNLSSFEEFVSAPAFASLSTRESNRSCRCHPPLAQGEGRN
ncbi:MAG: HisA/HisF-related TIM barrel protein [Gemmataceae bacterium]